MPHITTEQVKEIRNELKAKFPGVKFSVVREHHSSVKCAIMESPYEFERSNLSINHHEIYIKEHHEGKPYLNFLVEISRILTKNKKTISFDGDYGSIPNFYVSMKIGKWNKPHITNKNIKITWDKV